MENIVIKLGGSVITYKDKPLTPRINDINRLSREISEIANDFNLIIIHGGGSFGHYIAKKYAIYLGFPRIKIGLSILEKEMRKLNLIILESLINHGVPAFPISPSNIFLLKRSNIKEFYSRSITEAIKRGLIPVLYGDVILDEDYGCFILSGDQLCLELAKMVNSKKIIFCINVTGIYNKDPKRYIDAKLLKKINYESIPNLITKFTEGEDVTGGIVNKLKVAYEAAKEKIKCVFINGLSHNILKRAILNQEFIGTEVY